MENKIRGYGPGFCPHPQTMENSLPFTSILFRPNLYFCYTHKMSTILLIFEHQNPRKPL